jgi:hypothetical protein
MPDVGTHDLFEQDYTGKLKALMAQYGLLVNYERDRAALDLGLHLFEQPIVGDAHVSQVRGLEWARFDGQLVPSSATAI